MCVLHAACFKPAVYRLYFDPVSVCVKSDPTCLSLSNLRVHTCAVSSLRCLLLLCCRCGEESKLWHQHQQPGRKEELSHGERPDGRLEHAFRFLHRPGIHVCDGLQHLTGYLGFMDVTKVIHFVYVIQHLKKCLHVCVVFDQAWQISSTRAASQERTSPATLRLCASCAKATAAEGTDVRRTTMRCTTATKERSGNSHSVCFFAMY